jgi:hypothetical protein
MSETNTNPVAPAVNQAPVAAAAPAAENVTPAPAGAALSTAALTDRIRDQLLGKNTTTTTPPAPGQQPSPDAPGTPNPENRDSAPPPATNETPAPDPEGDDDDATEEPQGLPPQALAALSEARKAKREAKARAKALETENATLKAQLAAAAKPPAETKPGDEAPPADVPRPAKLVEAEKAVASAESLRNWARSQTAALRKAVDAGDATQVIAAIQAQVKGQVALPDQPEAIMDWLDTVHTSAVDRLEVARGDVRFHQHQAEQQGQTMLAESRTLASSWAPKMADPESEQGKRAAMIRNFFPGIDQHPLGPRIIAAAVRGWEVITAEQTKAKTGAARPATTTTATLPPKPGAKLPGAPSVVPPRPDEGQQNSGALLKRMADPSLPEEEREKLKTIDQLVGNQEDWAQYVTNIEMRETPYLDWLPTGDKPVNPLFSYQAERFRTPRRNAHVDGKPFSEPYSAGDSRAQLKALIQWFDHGVSVSKLTQDVTNIAGIADELAREIPKALKEMSSDMEVNFLEDNDHREDNKVVGYLTRGVGSWMSTSAQALYPVDSNFRPPSASVITTAWSSVTEDGVRGMLQSIWEETKSNEMLTAWAGSDAIKGISDWQHRIPSSASTVNPAVKRTFKDKTITRAVRHYEGDFMDVEYVPNPWLVFLTGSASARKGRVYYQHRSKWEIRWNQKPRVYRPEFKGGSYEAFMDAIVMQVCKNPRGEGMHAPT